MSSDVPNALQDMVCPIETANHDYGVLSASDLLLAEYARPANTIVQDSEGSSTHSIHSIFSGASVYSKASQVSAGDGVVVKGLKQNLKHFKDAQKALDKRTGFWTRIAYHKLSARVKHLEDGLKGVCRMLNGYVAQAEKFEIEFKYSAGWTIDPYDMGEMLNDISALVESTVVEPLYANTEQVFATLEQTSEYVHGYGVRLAAVLDHTARESETDELSILLHLNTVNGKIPDQGSGKATRANEFKEKSKRSATRKAKEHPLRKEGVPKDKLP